MKTIQEIAVECYESFEQYSAYDWRFVVRKNCSGKELKLIDYGSDEYLFKFLQFSLDTISKIHQNESTPDEMRLSRTWSEPDFTLWDSSDLWKWLISDPTHLRQVQEHVSRVHELGQEPDLNTCIQFAVWDEWREVFESVKDYLVEEYNAQPDEDDDEECDEE